MHWLQTLPRCRAWRSTPALVITDTGQLFYLQYCKLASKLRLSRPRVTNQLPVVLTYLAAAARSTTTRPPPMVNPGLWRQVLIRDRKRPAGRRLPRPFGGFYSGSSTAPAFVTGNIVFTSVLYWAKGARSKMVIHWFGEYVTGFCASARVFDGVT